MKKREALKPYINTQVDASVLAEALRTDLELVSDAYSATQSTLIELEKAYARIDSIAAQEGSAQAVRAFRDIAAAHKDLAATLIALRAEGRATVQAKLAASATPPSPASELEETGQTPSVKISSPRVSDDLPGTDSNNASGIDSDSAPVVDIELPNNHSLKD